MSAPTKILYAAFAAVTLSVATLTANAAPGDLFASVTIGPGFGVGAVFTYTPSGVQSTFASELNRPRGLAFDGAGNLIVATTFCGNTCDLTVLRISPDGAQEVFGVIPGTVHGQGLAIDGSGNAFVMATAVTGRSLPYAAIYKFTPDGKRKMFAVLPQHPAQGFGLAFDSSGNLFAASPLDLTIYKFGPDGTRTVFVGPEAFEDFEGGPIGLTFDRFGNLFVSAEGFPFTDDRIFKFTPAGVKSTFATGLRNPRALAFDSAGNLFVGETPFFATGDILKFAPDGTFTVFASGIGRPEGFGGPTYFAIQP